MHRHNFSTLTVNFCIFITIWVIILVFYALMKESSRETSQQDKRVGERHQQVITFNEGSAIAAKRPTVQQRDDSPTP